MIVLDAVLIKGPGYKAEDCRAGNKEGAGPLTRVKKVVSAMVLLPSEQHISGP